MADIGYCYGSEYQMMRFLAHHKNYLENIIKANTPLKGPYKWMDYPYDQNRLSFDGEHVGINFFENFIEFNEIKQKWRQFWPQTGTAQNWDAIFLEDKKVVLIEAKAHIEEIRQSCDASEKSRELIGNSFQSAKKYFGISLDKDWFNNYYQLANRLAFVYFLKTCGIESYVLNIYFINGYIKRIKRNDKIIIEQNRSVTTVEEWEEAIEMQYECLGLKNTIALNYVQKIFVDCLSENKK